MGQGPQFQHPQGGRFAAVTPLRVSRHWVS
jgi:hypothetical protein